MREGNVQGLQNRHEGIGAFNDLRPTVLDKTPACDCAALRRKK
jgi:hypothetical protein